MQNIMSKLGQKDGMQLGNQRPMAIGVIKSQWLILNGDHLECM